MLKRNTLFVVGAGGSVDFGFPIGSQLVADIYHYLVHRKNDRYAQGDRDLIDGMEVASGHTGIALGDYYRAGVKLGNILAGKPVSIDNVVHTHRSDDVLVAVAKLAIARIILEREGTSVLKLKAIAPLRESANTNDNWLNFVFTRHFAGFELSELPRVFERLRFISFNYDRCVIQSARRAFASNFHADDHDVFGVTQTLQVHHPYGSLGLLPNVARGGDLGFGQDVTPARIFQMSQQIRTFTEGLDDKSLQDNILESISWAERIVFVGFGYLGMNMKLLKPLGMAPRSKLVFGSAYKMSSTAAADIQRVLLGQFSQDHVFGLDVTQNAFDFLWEFEKQLFD